MTNARSVVVALCVSATVLACGPGTLVPSVTEPPLPAGSRADFDAKLTLGVALARVRGQSLVSFELGQRHQFVEAMRALTLAREGLQPIEDLGGANTGPEFMQLGRAIDDAISRLRRTQQHGIVAEALATAGRATLGIESKFVGATSERPAYRASIESVLVDEAAFYYEIAVGSEPFDLVAYRTAYGLLREADNIHEGLTTFVEELTHDNARAADTLLAAMFGAMPSSEPPADLPPPDEVAAAAYLLGVLLTDDHGAVSLPPRNRLAYIAPLLEEALGAYESGEAGVADVLIEKVRASLCCPSTSAGNTLAIELERLSNAVRSGAQDSDIVALVEESSQLASEAAGDQ